MAQNINNINMTEILLQCMGKAYPMLEMLKWLCGQFMEAELSDRTGADKNERSEAALIGTSHEPLQGCFQTMNPIYRISAL